MRMNQVGLFAKAMKAPVLSFSWFVELHCGRTFSDTGGIPTLPSQRNALG